VGNKTKSGKLKNDECQLTVVGCFVVGLATQKQKQFAEKFFLPVVEATP
jgi:hypothetical protein